MIYPEYFEQKIGAEKIRELAGKYCMYEPGRIEIQKLSFSSDHEVVMQRLNEVEEFRQILIRDLDFPIDNFIDISASLKKAKTPGRFLEQEEFLNIRKVTDSVRLILNFLKKDEENKFKSLKAISDEVKFFPLVTDKLNSVLNKHGKLKDNASANLADIRKQLHLKGSTITRKLNRILEKARKDGMVEEDAMLAVRNGRSVIPVPANNKRALNGYIHDESATGKTAYIEPIEIVEANNEIRELELAEKREIVKILTLLTDFIRPYIPDLHYSHFFLAKIDSIRARARFAQNINAVLPKVLNSTEADWKNAYHPLLLLSFRAAGREKQVVPLDIKLNEKDRILLISGPNAGGKSVCLQTLGLLQYMIQTGFLVTVDDSSVFGIFENIFLDMGDEQSLEDDLSTYSSHLVNMKNFSKNADEKSLILIDEFGSGTEPNLGAAIAEALLEQLNKNKVFGLITTHYTNLKHFASANEGLVNGAMLYDTHLLKPLFKLLIGRPGSSFAFEIARKIGLSEQILKKAEEIVGHEQVDYDKALKDLIRDKKYWENKRQKIRKADKKLSELVEKYDSELADTEKLRKIVLREAKDQAETLLSQSNKKIENTIREIREADAQKEKTKALRKDLEHFKEQVSKTEELANAERKQARELQEKIRELKQKKQQINSRNPDEKKSASEKTGNKKIEKGSFVRMKGQNVSGEVISISGNIANVVFGHLKTKVNKENLEKVSEKDYRQSNTPKSRKPELGNWDVGIRKVRFHPDIDVRGKRTEEALQLICELIDEAIMVQSHDLRVLHGKGNGILREMIRQYLAATDVVEWFGDEHVELGGSGITLIKLIN